MIRRSILSVIGGVVFAAALSLGVIANAACYGRCADTIGSYIFTDRYLTIAFDADTGEALYVAAVECYYIDSSGSGPVDPHIAE
jgi:hypothetical protein